MAKKDTFLSFFVFIFKGGKMRNKNYNLKISVNWCLNLHENFALLCFIIEK